MQKITPFLWFDRQAEQAAEFYTSLFDHSRISEVVRYTEGGPGPAGSVMTVSFELAGQQFIGLNGGPEFGFTPAISFFVHCDTVGEVDALWAKLSDGGTVLMPLDAYPFSEKFGWIGDRFGVSWQLSLGRHSQKIVPCLMFVGEQHGHAEDAVKQYTSLFEKSRIDSLVRYGPDEQEPEGTVQLATFTLEGQAFRAIDSGFEHGFTFTPAISFAVDCETQEEVDRYWDALTADGGAEQACGWLTDRYGVTWQIVPSVLRALLQSGDAEQSKRVMEAMFPMKKLDIKTLQAAYEG